MVDKPKINSTWLPQITITRVLRIRKTPSKVDQMKSTRWMSINLCHLAAESSSLKEQIAKLYNNRSLMLNRRNFNNSTTKASSTITPTINNPTHIVSIIPVTISSFKTVTHTTRSKETPSKTNNTDLQTPQPSTLEICKSLFSLLNKEDWTVKIVSETWCHLKRSLWTLRIICYLLKKDQWEWITIINFNLFLNRRTIAKVNHTLNFHKESKLEVFKQITIVISTSQMMSITIIYMQQNSQIWFCFTSQSFL